MHLQASSGTAPGDFDFLGFFAHLQSVAHLQVRYVRGLVFLEAPSRCSDTGVGSITLPLTHRAIPADWLIKAENSFVFVHSCLITSRVLVFKF